MSVKMIIERKFREAPLAEDFQLINNLRTGAMRQRGYITEETLVNLRDKREVAVVSYWANMDDWKSWSSSEQRRRLEIELAPRLEAPAKFRAFRLGALFENSIHDAEQSMKSH